MGHRLGGNTISPDASNPVSGIPELFLSSSRGFNEARVLLADTMQQLSVMTLYCSTCKYCLLVLLVLLEFLTQDLKFNPQGSHC